jgi:hypothetical protein
VHKAATQSLSTGGPTPRYHVALSDSVQKAREDVGMFGVTLRIQLAFNRWFENAILEDRYRYLARRGGFETAFDERLALYRGKKQYGAVRLAFADARYEHARRQLGGISKAPIIPPKPDPRRRG